MMSEPRLSESDGDTSIFLVLALPPLLLLGLYLSWFGRSSPLPFPPPPEPQDAPPRPPPCCIGRCSGGELLPGIPGSSAPEACTARRIVDEDVRALFGVSLPAVAAAVGILPLPLPSLSPWRSLPRCWTLLLEPRSDDLRLLGEIQAESRRISRVCITSLSFTADVAEGVPNMEPSSVEMLSERLVEDGEVYSSGSIVTEKGSRLSRLMPTLLPSSISMLSSRLPPHSSIRLFLSREKRELLLRLFLGLDMPALRLLPPALYGVCFLPRFFMEGFSSSSLLPSSSSPSSSSLIMLSKSSSHCASVATFLAVSLDTPCSSISFSVSSTSDGKICWTIEDGIGVISVMGWRKSNSAAVLLPNLTADWVLARVSALARRVTPFLGVAPLSALISSASVGVDT
mmetsp:Transcript_5924/g.13024  ORF Transcript_5924/g.13024 Transcript_5924/m.13024 type:complete len:399 (+) Transcript_5924:1814-3010(+)